MADERTLRRKARQAIRGGKLPARFPDRTWGGPGGGERCTICGAAIKRDELELEIEFAAKDGSSDRDRHHVHIRCFAAWESELRQLKRGEPVGSGDQPRSQNPAAAGTGPPKGDPGGGASRRVLPQALGECKISGRGSDQTYRHDPASRRGSR